ncbi:Transcriptional regulator, ArsR [Bacillus cereus Rock3-44]|nr:Transcriptional regulator, ArsR [Bacillus cereus Rock3-44]
MRPPGHGPAIGHPAPRPAGRRQSDQHRAPWPREAALHQPGAPA